MKAYTPEQKRISAEYHRRWRLNNLAKSKEVHRVSNWNKRNPMQRVSTGLEIDAIIESRNEDKEPPLKLPDLRLEGANKRCNACNIILAMAPGHNCNSSVQFIKEYGHSNK